MALSLAGVSFWERPILSLDLFTIGGEDLARSRNATRNRYRRLGYLIPIVALVVTAAVLVGAALPPPSSPAAIDFVDQIVIQITNKNGTQLLPNIIPAYAKTSIGEAAGSWANSTYNSYGVDPQHYPVYMDPPSISCHSSCLFHVKSKVVHQFTLGDFFNVWGQPLGQNNTVGITRFTNSYGTFAWELCVGPTGSAIPFTGPYGSLVLQAQMDITLIFYNNTNGVGCA
jgi:hypothetical protein